jgi:hypothetical protein
MNCPLGNKSIHRVKECAAFEWGIPKMYIALDFNGIHK